MTSHDPRVMKISCFDEEKDYFCCNKDHDHEELLIAEGKWDLSQLGQCENNELTVDIELTYQGKYAGIISIQIKFHPDDHKVAKEIANKAARAKKEAEDIKL